MKNILIRGKPGIGKTTLVINVANSLKKEISHKKDLVIGGFYTQEIREKNNRVGFTAKTFDGGEAVLSHVHPVRKKTIHGFSNGVNFKSGPRVGKYVVDIDVIDKLIVSVIIDAVRESDIVIIDEIGKMEMFSSDFKSSVIKALDSPKKVLATIPVYSNAFLDSIRSRDDMEIFDLDMDNRNKLPEKVLNLLRNENIFF